MGKLIVLLCFALVAMTLVMGCNRPGMLCTTDDDCCGPFTCNQWAGGRWGGRCTGKMGMGPVDPANVQGWGPRDAAE
ncbi:PREDICTED: uncharacterized protein LOC105567716 [Vollenhovia emeryi]|uniref:uncharacterized protein LOC105567716 n=1 Tax=Vollenhovia emeryi TaxID=411798 RepID=UPI0005F4B020|nr:PREDICTED: uncharacterized protein LOC105567716 [Vollenhovia emeryi]